MAVMGKSQPFGSPTRTRVLLALHLLGSSHARALARLLPANVSGVQKAIRSLERDGLVVGRAEGRTRVFQLDPRYFARRELDALLGRLVEAEPELRDRVADLRRRPRRTSKAL